MAKFTHEIGTEIKLIASDEGGKIIGRAEYENNQDQYLILYVAGDGRQEEQWWNESALTAA